MIINLIIKELENNLVSLRFFLTLTLILIVIIISSIIFTGDFKQQIEDYSAIENLNSKQLNENSENLSSVAHMDQNIQLKPSKTQLISEGGLNNIPKLFKVSTFDIDGPEIASRENKYLKEFKNVDWTFLISFILSFFAILLTYDAINGEKRDGTLRLLMSNSIGRNSVIIGKYVSSLICISIPLIIGIILSLLITGAYGQITFSGSQILRICIYIVVSIFYLSIFLLTGLLVSSISKNPLTSIIILLFIWVLFAVLIPHSGGKIASKLFSISRAEEIEQKISTQRSEIRKKHRDEYKLTFNWNGNIWAEWVPYRSRAVNAMDEARNKIEREFMRQRIAQIKNSKNVLKISPTSIFNSISEQICLTGIERYEHFYNQILEYRNRFKDFIIAEDKKDPDSPHCIYSWESSPMSQKPVDFNSIPRFEEEKLSVSESLQQVFFNFALLIIYNIMLFVFVYTAFMKYDVR